MRRNSALQRPRSRVPGSSRLRDLRRGGERSPPPRCLSQAEAGWHRVPRFEAQRRSLAIGGRGVAGRRRTLTSPRVSVSIAVKPARRKSSRISSTSWRPRGVRARDRRGARGNVAATALVTSSERAFSSMRSHSTRTRSRQGNLCRDPGALFKRGGGQLLRRHFQVTLQCPVVAWPSEVSRLGGGDVEFTRSAMRRRASRSMPTICTHPEASPVEGDLVWSGPTRPSTVRSRRGTQIRCNHDSMYQPPERAATRSRAEVMRSTFSSISATRSLR